MPVTTVATLLAQLTREPGRPRITWYGDDFERVELSGAVLENWVNKTTNLLVEEFDAAPGVRVLLDLPPHWRSLVWALAVWRTGASVVFAGTADVAVTTRPESASAPAVVAVSLPALSRKFDGPLPRSAIDAASAVMTYADVLGYVPATEPAAPALFPAQTSTAVDGAVPHASLAAWWASDNRDRIAVQTSDDTADFLRRSVGKLAAGGSVVALSHARGEELARTAGALDRLLVSEHATADW